MRFQIQRQRRRWPLRLARSAVFLLCAATIAGCAGVGPQGDSTAYPLPTLATTPPPITNDVPTHQAFFAGGFAAIKPHLSGTPSFSADDMKQYVSAHAIVGPDIVGPDIVGPDRGSGQPVVVLANFFSCAEIDQQVGGGVAQALNGCGAGATFGLVIESGGFAFDGPSGGAHLTAPGAFMVFDPASGNLLIYGSMPDQNGTPLPTPTSQPGQPTPTTTPHVALTMKPLSAEQSCGSSSATKLAPITLTLNASGSNVAVTWNATISDKIGATSTIWATISPSSGTLAAGHTTQITVTPANNICTLSQNIVPDATYHVVVHYGSGSTLTFADLVHSPIPG